ncbi:MAG: hypothetical protein ABEJ28_12680 [Salinigranum sp.]
MAETDEDDEGVRGRPTSEVSTFDTSLRWLFLTGNRFVIAGGLLVVIYGLLTVTGVAVGTINHERAGPLYYLFSALTGGNFTLITIVLSIAQLVITRQLGTPGELRDEIDATNAYRESIEESMGVDVAPVTPTEFLHLLLESCVYLFGVLREEGESADSEAWEDLEEVIDDIADHVVRVESVLSREDLGLFQALSVTLNTNYSEDIYRLRRLRNRHDYDEDVCGYLDELVVRLQQIDVARQYLKTLYMQDELSRLSRSLLYVGVPAVLVSIFMPQLFAASTSQLPPMTPFASVPAAITLSIAPLSVLFAYVLRLTAVAQRTVAITPFTIAGQEREE